MGFIIFILTFLGIVFCVGLIIYLVQSENCIKCRHKGIFDIKDRYCKRCGECNRR